MKIFASYEIIIYQINDELYNFIKPFLNRNVMFLLNENVNLTHAKIIHTVKCSLLNKNILFNENISLHFGNCTILQFVCHFKILHLYCTKLTSVFRNKFTTLNYLAKMRSFVGIPRK